MGGCAVVAAPSSHHVAAAAAAFFVLASLTHHSTPLPSARATAAYVRAAQSQPAWLPEPSHSVEHEPRHSHSHLARYTAPAHTARSGTNNTTDNTAAAATPYIQHQPACRSASRSRRLAGYCSWPGSVAHLQTRQQSRQQHVAWIVSVLTQPKIVVKLSCEVCQAHCFLCMPGCCPTTLQPEGRSWLCCPPSQLAALLPADHPAACICGSRTRHGVGST